MGGSVVKSSPPADSPPSSPSSSEPILSSIVCSAVQDSVFRKTKTFKQIASISYQEFLAAVKDLNDISLHFLDDNGKQLIFAVKKGTDTTLLWKATVRVAVVKVDSVSKNIDSYRPLNLQEFIQVYNSITRQASAIGESSESSGSKNKIIRSLFGSSGSLAKLNEEKQNYLTSLDECCICLERKPDVILPCAHSYCCTCIERWNVDNKTCPVCRETLSSSEENWVISELPDSEEIITEIQKSLMELAQ